MSLLARQLDAYLQTRGGTAFSWADGNCAHFAGGWICWATQDDPLDGLPPTPTPSSARDLVRRLAGDLGTLQQAVSLRLGRQPIPVAHAHLGDIVLMPSDNGVGGSLGICSGMSALVLTESGAVVPADLQQALAAWRLRP